MQCTFWHTQLNIWTEQRSMGSPLSLGLAKYLNLFGFKYSEWWNVSPSETTSAFFQVQFWQLCKGFMQVWMNSNTGVKDKRQVEQMVYLWSFFHVWPSYLCLLIPVLFHATSILWVMKKTPPYFNLLLIKSKFLTKLCLVIPSKLNSYSLVFLPSFLYSLQVNYSASSNLFDL